MAVNNGSSSNADKPAASSVVAVDVCDDDGCDDDVCDDDVCDDEGCDDDVGEDGGCAIGPDERYRAASRSSMEKKLVVSGTGVGGLISRRGAAAFLVILAASFLGSLKL